MDLLISVIVTALVASFGAQLIVYDDITARLRDWVEVRHAKGHRWLWFPHAIMSCHRCCGVWTSLAAAPFVLDEIYDLTLRNFLLTALGASYTSFWLMEHVSD